MFNDSITSMNQLFWTGTGAWTLSGAAVLSLYDNGGTQAKIENQSTALVTINAPITFAATSGAAFGEINAVNGDITFGSGALTVNGSQVNGIKMFSGGHTVTYNNTVSASGKWFATTSATGMTMAVGGAFTSGDIYLMNGSALKLNSGGSISTSALRLGGDFGTTLTQDLTKGATFQLTSGNGGLNFAGIINTVSSNTSNALLIDSLNTSGTNTLSGGSFLDSDLKTQVASGGTLNFSGGSIDIKNRKLTISGSGTTIINEALSSSLTAGGYLLKEGSGTLILQGTSNNYTGTNSGTLNANGTQISGGILGIYADTSLGLAPAGAYNNIQFIGSGTLQDTANNITLNANRNISVTSGTATFDTLGNTLTISGTIGSSTGFIKTGTGTLIVVAANTALSGTAFVNAGTLSFANSSAPTLGTAVINLADGTAVRWLGDGNSGRTNFPSNAITVANSGTASISFGAASSGYSGLFTGAADSYLKVDNNSTLPLSNTGAKQFQNFLGTVEVTAGSGIRYTPTGGFANGGDSTTFIVNGSMYSRNGGSGALGALSGTGSIQGSTNSGAVTYTIGAKGIDSTFAGNITGGVGGVSISKTGTATLTLSGTMSSAGAVTVNNGMLRFNGNKTGAGAIAVNLGTLAGTGTALGVTTVSGTARLAPGDSSAPTGIGTLKLGSLTLTGGNGSTTGAILDFEFGAGNDKVVLDTSGVLTLNNGIRLNLYNDKALTAFSTNGTYTLFDASAGTVSGFSAGSSFVVQNPVAGRSYSFLSTSGTVQMVIDTIVTPNYWALDSNSSWNTASNWSQNLIPNFQRALANFGPGISGTAGTPFTGPHTVTLDGVQTVGQIIFNDVNSFTITSGSGGSLVLDNSAVPSAITVTTGTHSISAPIAVSAQGLGVDVASGQLVTLSNTVSGTSAALTKTSAGTLALTGSNTYAGGTTLTSGTLQVNSDASLGATSGNLVFGGGTLQLLSSATSSRNYQVSGASNANIDTNGSNLTLNTGISRVAAATGGVVKSGGGTLTLAGSNSYTGSTTVNLGSVVLDASGVINGTTVTVNGGGTFTNNGSLAGTTGTAANGTFLLSSGTAVFSSAVNASDTASLSNLIRMNGGSLSAASVSVGRTNGGTISSEPTAGSTGMGFYVTGGTANISGAMNIVGSNSTASARIDGGEVNVGGTVTIGLGNTGRWSVLDVNGGTFTSTGASTGIQIGSGSEGNAEFLVRAGTATVEKVTFFGTGASTYAGVARVNGGSLYVGSGGIVATGTNPNFASTIKLAGGTLGAKADWASAVNLALTGTSSIRAADASNVAHDIALSGVLSGTGSFTKTGDGTLTLSGSNSYTGGTTLTSGTLVLGDNYALGTTGTLTMNGGDLASSAGGRSIANPVVVTGTIGGITGDNNLTFTGGASGSGNFVVKGTGTVKISGAENSFRPTGIQVNNGGTLLLGGSNQINSASTAVNLAGGTLAMTGTMSDSVGALTLSQNSTIDMGTGSAQLTLYSLGGLTSNSLSIYNWSGNLGTGGGTDRLFLSTTTLLDLNQIKFFDGGAGSTQIGYATLRLDGGELVPVPEPATIIGAFAFVGMIVLRERRRLRSLLRVIRQAGVINTQFPN